MLRLAFPQDSGINAPGSTASGLQTQVPLQFSYENVQGQPRGTYGRDSPFPLPSEECSHGDLVSLAFRRPRAFRPHLTLSLQAFQPIGRHRELGFSAEDPVPRSLPMEHYL